MVKVAGCQVEYTLTLKTRWSCNSVLVLTTATSLLLQRACPTVVKRWCTCVKRDGNFVKNWIVHYTENKLSYFVRKKKEKSYSHGSITFKSSLTLTEKLYTHTFKNFNFLCERELAMWISRNFFWDKILRDRKFLIFFSFTFLKQYAFRKVHFVFRCSVDKYSCLLLNISCKNNRTETTLFFI